MLSTKRHGSSILTIKDMLDNGFVAGGSSHIHSSPVCSYMDSSSVSKTNAWELLMDLDNATKGSSLCVVKQPESLSSCVKTDLHGLTQGISDLSLVCFCKAHRGQATLDLSSLSCEHLSRAGCLIDVASHNTSTPCKKEKHPKLLESLLSKSTELPVDLSTLGKMPTPRWDISAIKPPLDASLSLDMNAEELRLLGCSKHNVSSLESSVVTPSARPGAFNRHSVWIHSPATLETLLTVPVQPRYLPERRGEVPVQAGIPLLARREKSSLREPRVPAEPPSYPGV
ncbi:uncharacterized protein [Phaenicophaeus curvirostris]|uniref:uncharacterized protein n=1 Tax=Phaenicophaeus curvirostris TaxID=33595 RepID=UPI0037F10118